MTVHDRTRLIGELNSFYAGSVNPVTGVYAIGFFVAVFVKILLITLGVLLALTGCSSLGPQLLTLRDGTQFITSGAVEFNRASKMYEYVDTKGRTILLEPNLVRSVEPYRARQ